MKVWNQLSTSFLRAKKRLKNLLNGLRLGPFQADDNFLRRVSKKKLIREGIIAADAFLDNHPTLSFTLQRDELKTDAGLTRFHLAKKLPHGDIPGIVAVSYHDLTVSLEPPLPPWCDIDFDDRIYGYLHCNTNPLNDEIHRDKLAKLASKHGILRQFVDRKHV